MAKATSLEKRALAGPSCKPGGRETPGAARAQQGRREARKGEARAGGRTQPHRPGQKPKPSAEEGRKQERCEPPNGRPSGASSSMAVGSNQAKNTRVLNPGRPQERDDGRHTLWHGQQGTKPEYRNGREGNRSRTHAKEEGAPGRRQRKSEP